VAVVIYATYKLMRWFYNIIVKIGSLFKSK